MREHVSKSKKATASSFSIPTLKQPTRGFGLNSPGVSSQATTQMGVNKPLAHDISRISLRSQTKLTVNQPGDIYEQEADRVAQQVMQRMSAPAQNQQSIQREELPEEEEELQMKSLNDGNIPSLQREALPEEEEELQMKSLTDGNIPSLQREALPEEEEELQMKSLTDGNIPSLQREELPEEEEELQMKSLANSINPVVQRQGGAMTATSDLETSIQQQRQSGQPLADDIRQPMEQAFGADFGGVKIHTDSRSDELNQSIQARAFTTGQDIFFRQGEYAPQSQGGKELLAHELTHVVQQNGSALGRKLLPEQGIEKNNIQGATLLNSSSGYQPLIQRGPFDKVKKLFSKDGGDEAEEAEQIEEIEVRGEDWKKYMELDSLTMEPSDILIGRQFGHGLVIKVKWYNKSQKRLHLMTPPPLEYFEEITTTTTDSGGNRNTDIQSLDQYARNPGSNTFLNYVWGTRNKIVDPGNSLMAAFLDPPQMTITQEYRSRTVKFKIGLQGSQQWLTGEQRLTCDNNQIIEHDFIPGILRAG